MKKLKMYVALLLAMLSLNNTAFAAISCQGNVGALLVYADGNVNLNATYRGDYTIICNLKTEWQGVATATCAMWVASLAAAKKAGQSISVWYESPTATSCLTIPTYGTAPPPTYISF